MNCRQPPPFLPSPSFSCTHLNALLLVITHLGSQQRVDYNIIDPRPTAFGLGLRRAGEDDRVGRERVVQRATPRLTLAPALLPNDDLLGWRFGLRVEGRGTDCGHTCRGRGGFGVGVGVRD
jgi:hypothetical protein